MAFFHHGHALLLLQSGRWNRYATRVDILFKGVGYMSLPSDFSSLSVDELDWQFAKARVESLFKSDDRLRALAMNRKFFVIEEAHARGFVVAAGCWALEHETDDHLSSPLLKGVLADGLLRV